MYKLLTIKVLRLIYLFIFLKGAIQELEISSFIGDVRCQDVFVDINGPGRGDVTVEETENTKAPDSMEKKDKTEMTQGPPPMITPPPPVIQGPRGPRRRQR
ncbi:Uncharacterised protein r2_g2405 [Pycnogonum litorale]